VPLVQYSSKSSPLNLERRVGSGSSLLFSFFRNRAMRAMERAPKRDYPLTRSNVTCTFVDCLGDPFESRKAHTRIVEGPFGCGLFDIPSIEYHQDRIRLLLAETRAQLKFGNLVAFGAFFYRFGNVLSRRRTTQWTTKIEDVEMLLMLGEAAGIGRMKFNKARGPYSGEEAIRQVRFLFQENQCDLD